MNFSFFYIYKCDNALLNSFYYSFFSIYYNKLIVLIYVHLLYLNYILFDEFDDREFDRHDDF